MRKISDMYKMYRDIPLYSALEAALEELCDDTAGPALLPLHLATTAVHAYDRAVLQTVQAAEAECKIIGSKMAVFRVLKDHSWLLLTDAVVTWGGRLPRAAARPVRCDKLLLRCYTPHADTAYEPAEELEPCPYTVAVEPRVRIRRKKMTMKKKATVAEGTFNPALHATLLGAGAAGAGGAEAWRRPQPYNEKLRRAGTEEERQALAVSHGGVGMVDVLKGRFRKRAAEYPHRCVDAPLPRRALDLQVVPGPDLVAAARNYTVALRAGDRSLATQAAGYGGSLALAAHNVHVVEGGLETARDKYTTRRREKIGHLTFDSIRDFDVVEPPTGKRRIVNTSSSSPSSSEASTTSGVAGKGPRAASKGWNSFGSFQIPKKPKASKPCPKSRRDAARGTAASSQPLLDETVKKPDAENEDVIVPKTEKEDIKEDVFFEKPNIDLDFLDDVDLEDVRVKPDPTSEVDMLLALLDPKP